MDADPNWAEGISHILDQIHGIITMILAALYGGSRYRRGAESGRADKAEGEHQDLIDVVVEERLKDRLQPVAEAARRAEAVEEADVEAVDDLGGRSERQRRLRATADHGSRVDSGATIDARRKGRHPASRVRARSDR